MRRWCNPLSEMVGLAVCPFLGVVLLLWALGTQAALAPFSTYEQVFQYSDGSISTNQTAQFYLSDGVPGGLIQVGEHTLQVQSLPPTLRYRSREVARIPKSVSLHTEEVYLAMGDGNPGVVRTEREVASASRRLLQDADPNAAVLDSMPTQEEYDQYQFITGDQTCRTNPLHDFEQASVYWFNGFYEVTTGLRAITHLRTIELQLRSDPRPAVSDSVYMRKIEVETSYGDATRHVASFQKYAKNVLNAVWLTRGLTVVEIEMLRMVECSTFPGSCFTRGWEVLGMWPYLSRNHVCYAFRESAMAKALNFERTTPYNLGGGLASPLSAYFADQLQALNNSFLSQIKLNEANSGWAGAVGLALKAVNESLFAQGGINSQVQQLFRDQVGINTRLNDNDAAITSAVELMYATSRNTTDQLISALRVESERVDALNSGTNNATNLKFSVLIDTLKNMSIADEAKFLQLYRGIQDVSGLLQSTSAQLLSFIKQKQFNRLLTRQFYQSSDALLLSGSDEFPLVSGTGIRPTVLSGVQLKALVDTIIITSGTGAVHAVRLDFFADSHVMLNASRPWTTVEQLVMWIGILPTCVIRANAPPQSSYNVTNYCTMWVEVVDLNCVSGYRSSDNTCTGPSTNSSLTWTTSMEMFSFFYSVCLGSPEFTVASVSLSTASIVRPSLVACNSTFNEKMLTTDRSRDLLVVTLTYVWTAFMQTFQTTLQSLELLAYGQLPNGVHTEPTSMGYSPGPISGVDGGRGSLQGMRAYWLSVSRDTLPVTSLTFVSESSKEREVTIDLVTAPNCSTNGNVSSPCYSVKNTDLRTNWVFRDQTGVTLPQQMVVVGDITSPSFSTIYDVPLSLIETTSNTLVRENLLTYLMMPAGTETMQEFGYFESISSGLFNSRAGSASAADYRFPALFDNDGYPVCNIDGGIPITSSFITPVDNCVPPFVTSAPFFISDYSLFGAPPVTPSSGVCAIAPPSPLQLNSVVLLFSQQARIPYPNGTMYLPQGASLSVSWTTHVEWSFSLWVNVLRSPSGQTGIILWRGTMTDDNAVQHDLQLRWGGCGSTDTDSGVLYMCVDAPNGFSVKVTTADYGTCIPGSCKYPETRLNSWSFLVITVSATKAHGYINGVLTYFSMETLQGRIGALMSAGSLVSLPVTAASDVFLVRSLKFYSWALTKDDVDTEMRCSQLTIVPRCWAPASRSVGTNLSWVPSSAVQIADTSLPVLRLHELRPSCLGRSSGLLVSVDRRYDSMNSVPVTTPSAFVGDFSWSSLLSTGVFTVSFWLRRLVDLGSLVYTDGEFVFLTTHLGGFTPGPPQLTVTLTLKRSVASCVAYSWVSAIAPITMDIGAYSNLVPEPTARHYSVSVVGESAALFIDGVLHGFVGNSTCSAAVQTIIDLSPGCSHLSSIHAGYSDMDCSSAQLVRVYSGALTGHQIQEATACERSSFSVGNITALYEFPLAVCTRESADSSVGYCRHSMMCQGHCAAYSTLTSQLFTPLQIVCDSGWLPPTCVSRCSRVDEFGECIEQTQVLTSSADVIADAFSPNGYWCMALKFFQAGGVSINGQSFVDFSYRQYEYITDLTIPTGQVVSIVPAGRCPAVALQQNGDASVWVVLTNIHGDYTQLIIHVKTVGACSAPSICCDDSYPLVLAPLSVYNWNLPSLCSAMQMEIFLDFGNGQSSCQTLGATTVATQLAASVSAPVVANVARSIVVTGNEVLNSLAGTTQQIVEFQIAIARATYDAAMRGLDVRSALDAASVAISKAPPPTLPDAPVLTNPFDDPRFSDVIKNLTKAINETAGAIGNQDDEVLTLVSLGAQFNSFVQSVSSTVAHEQTKLTALQHQFNLTNAVFRSSIQQMELSLIAFNAAIPDQVNAITSSSASGGIPTVALVFLTMGSVMGALAACWVAWPYAKDVYHSTIGWILDNIGFRRRRFSDMQMEEDGPNFSDDSNLSPEFASPQSNITARVSHEARRMTEPHLYK